MIHIEPAYVLALVAWIVAYIGWAFRVEQRLRDIAGFGSLSARVAEISEAVARTEEGVDALKVDQAEMRRDVRELMICAGVRKSAFTVLKGGKGDGA